MHSRTSVALIAALMASAPLASAQVRPNIVLDGKMIFPESITSASDGTVWMGSTGDGAVYRARPGETTATVWIPAGTAGVTRSLGVLADERSKTLWVCASAVRAANGNPAVPTAIKAFDIATGALKGSYPFAGNTGGCNDFAVAPNGTVYASDFSGSRMMRLRPGGTEFEQWLADSTLAAVDGVAILADGAVYVNTFRAGNLYRIRVMPDGSAGPLVKIRTSAPLSQPDGMRPSGPSTLLIAEGAGRLTEARISANGEEAEIRVIRDGFTGGPTAVTQVGGTAYVLEAKFAMRQPGQDPGVFQAIAVPYMNGVDPRTPNAGGQTPAFPGQTRADEHKSGVAFDVVTVASGLTNPWGLAFLPGGRMLVTERAGRLRVVGADGTLSEPVAGLPAVAAQGQGGLLDVALHPDFARNNLVYWSYAEPRDSGMNNTAVAHGKFVDGAAPRVENVEVIFHQMPSMASRLHFGGRLVWARDGKLFVTLGERSITEGRMQAQRMDGLLGKIVRLEADGKIPRDNPFVGKEGMRPEIWSLGHRNVQGATLNPATGELWEVEHGTRGGDEINIARKGKDYGWPTIAYGIEYAGPPITGNITQKEGMEQPLYFWDPVIAPSGLMFYTGNLFPAWKGNLFVGGLASMNLVRLVMNGERVVGEERLLTDLQPQRTRIRDVRQGPEGAIYLLTDEATGRILKLVPPARR